MIKQVRSLNLVLLVINFKLSYTLVHVNIEEIVMETDLFAYFAERKEALFNTNE